ncbi:DUF1214 domain-containing protein [Nocardioides alcanivorans]|uniref:DUF1214 domain-containing protein n=1 Tax=Nocardioides alcanivorans TaxID=2897352 RepID=UPI001F29CA94|nr:DUF1214 domain-containing protein [Nocardioides alcanivorans]
MISGVRAGRELVDEQCRHLGVRSGGWGTNLVGPRFDGDHLLRAAVARDQIYVTVPEEGIYPLARTDSDGVSLDGRRSYRIHFPAGSLPPVAAFWSITLYDDDGFLVAEADGRHAVGDRTPGFVRSDGTATLGVGPTAPPDTTAWLPAPAGRST